MRKLLSLIVFILVLNTTYAQKLIRISGTVKSAEGNQLGGATISIFNKTQEKDSLKLTSDGQGAFNTSLTAGQSYRVVVSYIGFDNYVTSVAIPDSVTTFSLGDISLNPGANLLGNVTLESQKIQIKEDTVTYKVDSTMYRKNDNVEAILKNLPGVQVDKEGTVTAQGKQVTKVKVNGKEFFNGDVTTATRELNADMVDKIQIIDDYGDQAAFTGIKDGDPSKTLNIELKKDKIDEQIATLAHEMVHLKQYHMGELRDTEEKNIYLWNNVLKDMTDIDYHDYPWEIEAYGREVGLNFKYRKKHPKLLLG